MIVRPEMTIAVHAQDVRVIVPEALPCLARTSCGDDTVVAAWFAQRSRKAAGDDICIA